MNRSQMGSIKVRGICRCTSTCSRVIRDSNQVEGKLISGVLKSLLARGRSPSMSDECRRGRLDAASDCLVQNSLNTSSSLICLCWTSTKRERTETRNLMFTTNRSSYKTKGIPSCDKTLVGNVSKDDLPMRQTNYQSSS